MAIKLILPLLFIFPALISPVFIRSEDTCSSYSIGNSELFCELEQIKLKISRLESILEESTENLNQKIIYLEDREQIMEELMLKIRDLESLLYSRKADSSQFGDRLAALEEEVRHLWAVSRKNNFDLHMLKSKEQDSEKRLEVVTSQVQKMADIVTEHWIQIQRLEQALQMTEMRASSLKKKVGSTKCTFLKAVKMLGQYLSGKAQRLRSKASQTLDQLKRIFKSVKKYHHELQGLIKQEMERNQYTSVLANAELVFFMASALVTLPIMGAWMFLSSQFGWFKKSCPSLK